MEIIEKTQEKLKFSCKLNISLANAIRRSVNKIPILAIEECDIYKNDSALYDEVIAHRLGLIPLKNQKLKKGDTIELKLKSKGEEGGIEVMSGEFGDVSVYSDMPIVFLEKDQELEIVARAGVGNAKEHAKYSPGLIFYKHLAKIKISKEGESHAELAELYPDVFLFENKLKVKDASKFDLDNDDLSEFPGVEVSFDDNLVFQIESWGQISPREIFAESCNALKSDLNALLKTIK